MQQHEGAHRPGLGRSIAIGIDDGDAITVVSEAARDRRADSARGAGDEC